MSVQQEGPFTPENVLRFFEELTGNQFIDSDTQRPVMDLIQEAKSAERRKSAYELWLEEQDEETKLAHRMGAI